MKIQFNGTSPVLAPGIDDEVFPGDVIEVADDIAASLLAAGTAYPADVDGKPVAPIPPANPMWSQPAPAKPKKED